MARLFILAQTRFSDLAQSADAPAPGDVVAYFRQAQDAAGVIAERWRSEGISVVRAETLVGMDEARAIEAAARPACYEWYRQDGKDLSKWEGISVGDVLAPFIWIEYNFLYLIRTGIIFQRLLKSYPDAREIVCDLIDGLYFYCDNRRNPQTLPWRALLEDLAVRSGRTCWDLRTPPDGGTGVPAGFVPPRRSAPAGRFRQVLGWFSREGVRNWIRFALQRGQLPVAYFFAQGQVGRVAVALARRNRLRVVADWGCGPGVLPVPVRDVPAVPGRALRAAGERLRRALDRLERESPQVLVWEGMDFTSWFVQAVRNLLATRLDDVLWQVARHARLLRILKPEIVVLSAAYGVPNAVVAGLKPELGYRHYFINHGHDFITGTVFSLSHADRTMTYIAEGRDHLESYGLSLPPGGKPERVAIANPSVLAVEALRGRRPDPPQKRILVLNYSCCTPHIVVRSGYFDQYLIDIVQVARRLQPFGIRMVYRPHPGEVRDYARFVIEEMGAADLVIMDSSDSFSEAIFGCDGVVCNITTCYYQALYAGWPVIFHEPGFDARDFVGLPAAIDTGRPLTTTQDELFTRVLEVYDQDSATARFPKRFATELSGRFFNTSGSPPDEAVAAFLAGAIAPLSSPVADGDDHETSTS